MRPIQDHGSGDTDDVLRLAIIAAHPDDEVIGAGAQLLRFGEGCRVIHVTDGAPRDMRDAAAAGFETRDAYALARRTELYRAMAYAGVEPEQCVQLDCADQEASFQMSWLSHAIADLLARKPVDVVITHPYEGGHPDHDATAFAVHAAAAILLREGQPRPSIVEMTSYHTGPDGILTCEFLADGTPVASVPLSETERARKRTMLGCFATQARVLSAFGVECERFRQTAGYRFDRPPHAGRLYYEHFPWGVDGEEWRALATQSIRELELERAWLSRS